MSVLSSVAKLPANQKIYLFQIIGYQNNNYRQYHSNITKHVVCMYYVYSSYQVNQCVHAERGTPMDVYAWLMQSLCTESMILHVREKKTINPLFFFSMLAAVCSFYIQ